MGFLGKNLLPANRLGRSGSTGGDVESLTALFEQKVSSKSGRRNTGTPESFLEQQRRLQQREQEEVERARHEVATFRLSIRGLSLSLPRHLRQSKSNPFRWARRPRSDLTSSPESQPGYASKESLNPKFDLASVISSASTSAAEDAMSTSIQTESVVSKRENNESGPSVEHMTSSQKLSVDEMKKSLDNAIARGSYIEAYSVAYSLHERHHEEGENEEAIKYLSLCLSFAPRSRLAACYRQFAAYQESSEKADEYGRLAEYFGGLE